MICAICHHVAKFRVDIHIVPIQQPEIPEHQERILLCDQHIEDPGPAFGWDYKKAMGMGWGGDVSKVKWDTDHPVKEDICSICRQRLGPGEWHRHEAE